MNPNMLPQQEAPKRPRLSLQIKTSCGPATRSNRSYAVDPRDPTAFNTLSNVYVTAIERSTPVQGEPITAINTLQSFPQSTTSEYTPKDGHHRVVTPYVASYPETPLSATATSPRPMEISFPSVMTATPPLSAGPVEPNGSRVFSFAEDILAKAQATSPSRSSPRSANRPMRNIASLGLQQNPPYIHPQSLHSILRNSPLPPPSTFRLLSPRRQSLRLQEKAAKRVGYNNPLTQEIVNNMYTKSHIDLLCEETSPMTPPPPGAMVSPTSLDISMAFNPNEIQDGGQTPGPMEDMQRRMNILSSGSAKSSSPSTPAGIRKRKKKEKKRRWVWTIGQDEDEDEEAGGSIMALKSNTAPVNTEQLNTPIPTISVPRPSKARLSHMDELPTPSIESTGSESEGQDIYMSDTSSNISHNENRGLTPNGMDIDLVTPTAPPHMQQQQTTEPNRLTPVPEMASQSGGTHLQLMRDSPMPPELLKEG